MAASAAPFPVEETTIATLHAAYESGRATAVSVCQAHLDRIAAYDRKGPALGAIIINNPDALADAAALDTALESTGKLVGPLHGIPVLVKDNYDVAGLQTTGGSAALLGWVPETDATVISRIRDAGGIVLAKTTMSEWARGGNTTPAGMLSGIASALHWPAAVVPMGYSHESLPSGLQLLGRPWSDSLLIELAYAYEQTTRHRVPPTTVPSLRCQPCQPAESGSTGNIREQVIGRSNSGRDGDD
jgi:Asp-tRNA(Asn)/Glu-tRNA(Gln) amidotransferase A subunit family amidase